MNINNTCVIADISPNDEQVRIDIDVKYQYLISYPLVMNKYGCFTLIRKQYWYINGKYVEVPPYA